MLFRSQRSLDEIDTRPKKKARLQAGLLGPGLEKFDATGLVPFYTDASEVPKHLQKCESLPSVLHASVGI